ncbi:hypothetical protein BD414DRAFT_478226 [Trametes punicea]|nr:hypothetical protein BD414DRAFT_478226 [Trametes punicea]
MLRVVLQGGEGVWLVGGCGGVFSRADALKRHLSKTGCWGDHRGEWLADVWEAMAGQGAKHDAGASEVKTEG